MTENWIPLDVLLGFDPGGLFGRARDGSMREGEDERVLLVREEDEFSVFLTWFNEEINEPYLFAVNDKFRTWVDVYDAATRDRLTRYLAGMLDLEFGSSAPRWFHEGHGIWGLSTGIGHNRYFMPTRTPESVAHTHEDGTHMLPSLWWVDHLEPTVLPDNSRRVAADALGLVVRYFAGGP